MQATTVREELRKLAEQLPDDADWDDVIYAIEFRRSVERGLADIDAGRAAPWDEVKRRVGIADTE